MNTKGFGIMCKHCGDTLYSNFRHDYKVCKCGKVSVDGGSDYLRMGYPDGNPADHITVIDRTGCPIPKYFEGSMAKEQSDDRP
jgi:hypothetical protein